jgi:hypothetical protein
MNNKRVFLLLALGACGLPPVYGQTAAPRDFSVKVPREPASYVIRYQDPATPVDPAAEKPGEEKLAEIQVTRADGWQRNVELYLGNKRKEDWLKGSLYLYQDLRGGWVNVLDLAADQGAPTGRPVTLPDAFKWAAAGTYVKDVRLGNRDAQLFERQVEGGPPERLWVDVETRLPLAIENRDGLGRIEFRDPGALSLKLPENHAQRLQRHEAITALPTRRARPK